MTSTPITPETRIGALLSAYPELEAVLIDMAPAFRKLKNPVLRRTVARLATLEQAAKIAGIPVRDMVVRLREAVGQGTHDMGPEMDRVDSGGSTPVWVMTLEHGETIDADALLDAGESPLGVVLRLVKELAPGEGLRIRSSFRPEPLIDALSKETLVHCRATGPDSFETLVMVGPAERVSIRGPQTAT